MKILNYFNARTLLVLAISQLSAFVTIHFQIKFNLDLLLFSLAIAFPLAFSIQSAFKRRDKALEYFGLFKAGTVALRNSFRISEDLTEEKKNAVHKLLADMTDQFHHQLENHVSGYGMMQQKVDAVMAFIEANRDALSNRNILRMIRYLKDITESSAYLIGLVSHRTMAGLRFYTIAFITIFPIVQAPILLYRLENIVPSGALYGLLAFSSLILVTLSNFQKMIEYPFDPKGIDNIKVREFSLDS